VGLNWTVPHYGTAFHKLVKVQSITRIYRVQAFRKNRMGGSCFMRLAIGKPVRSAVLAKIEDGK